MDDARNIRDRLLDAAERRARAAGYGGFSFRELGSDVGVKSASVHYHFPTKADLAFALMERYRLAAMASLGDVTGLTAKTALVRLIDLFRSSAQGRQMCLCGALGVAAESLPPQVAASSSRFAEDLTEWLAATQEWDQLPMPPHSVVALLEGALLLSVAAGDPDRFEQAIAPLVNWR